MVKKTQNLNVISVIAHELSEKLAVKAEVFGHCKEKFGEGFNGLVFGEFVCSDIEEILSDFAALLLAQLLYIREHLGVVQSFGVVNDVLLDEVGDVVRGH